MTERYKLRIHSPLPAPLEMLVRRTIGCCIRVHRELGPGYVEHVYRSALEIELAEAALSFECEKIVPVRYRGRLLCRHRLDLVVEREVLLELKSADGIAAVHYAQVISYLKAAQLRVGLLVNFNVPLLPQGLRRIVL